MSSVHPVASHDVPTDAPTDVVVRRYGDFAAFANRAQEWNRLAGDVPFRQWEWLKSWWEAYGDEGRRELSLLVAERAGELIGVAPLMRETDFVRGRTMRFLGSGAVCSDYLSILCKPDEASAVTDAFADALARMTSLERAPEDRFDAVELEGAALSDAPLSLLAERLAKRGFSVVADGIESSWRLTLPGTWNEYLESLSKSHRKKIRRLDREWLETGRVTLHEATDDASLIVGLAILSDLHERRRRTLGETGRFADRRFAEFVQRAARGFLVRDALGLYWLTLDGRPIAAEIHVRGDGVSYAYQSGLEPDAMDCEPGRLITIALLKSFIERKFRAVDFLRGDEPYKAHFRAEPVALCRFRFASPTVSGRMRDGLLRTRDAMKRWLRKDRDLGTLE